MSKEEARQVRESIRVVREELLDWSIARHHSEQLNESLERLVRLAEAALDSEQNRME